MVRSRVLLNLMMRKRFLLSITFHLQQLLNRVFYILNVMLISTLLSSQIAFSSLVCRWMFGPRCIIWKMGSRIAGTICLLLDNHLNQLIQLELFVNSGTLCLSIYSQLTAIFSMNIPYTWNDVMDTYSNGWLSAEGFLLLHFLCS